MDKILVTQIEIFISICVTNDHTSFHLWLKKKLVKCQIVSKYFDYACSYNCLFPVLSLSKFFFELSLYRILSRPNKAIVGS